MRERPLPPDLSRRGVLAHDHHLVASPPRPHDVRRADRHHGQTPGRLGRALPTTSPVVARTVVSRATCSRHPVGTAHTTTSRAGSPEAGRHVARSPRRSDRQRTVPSATEYAVSAPSTVTTAPTAGTTSVPGSTGTVQRGSGESSSGRSPPASAVTSTGRASSVDAVKATEPANATATASATHGTGCRYQGRRVARPSGARRPRRTGAAGGCRTAADGARRTPRACLGSRALRAAAAARRGPPGRGAVPGRRSSWRRPGVVARRAQDGRGLGGAAERGIEGGVEPVVGP